MLFNSDFTFESFIVKESNEEAFKAAKDICEPQENAYPLFICGGSGLGKTHLLHAIVNRTQSTQPDLKLCYTTCEDFVNDFVDAAMDGAEDAKNFLNDFFKIDVLLFEDIQFINSLDSTKEVLLRFFFSLFRYKKKIVITSDCVSDYVVKLCQTMKESQIFEIKGEEIPKCEKI